MKHEFAYQSRLKVNLLSRNHRIPKVLSKTLTCPDSKKSNVTISIRKYLIKTDMIANEVQTNKSVYFLINVNVKNCIAHVKPINYNVNIFDSTSRYIVGRLIYQDTRSGAHPLSLILLKRHGLCQWKVYFGSYIPKVYTPFSVFAPPFEEVQYARDEFDASCIFEISQVDPNFDTP